MFEKIRQFRSAFHGRRFRRRVVTALAVNRRGEARPDGLSLNYCHGRLELEWRARQVHPWDRELPLARTARLFVEQCLEDTEVALRRLFAVLPEIDLIDFKVTHPLSGALILSGSVTRQEAYTVRAHSSGMRLKQLGVIYRLQGWQFEPLG
jgi:hypothetical protein